MKEKFSNIVRFGTTDSDNYYQNNSGYSELVAKTGDVWRFLVPKSDLKGKDYRFVDVVLTNPKTEAILHAIGKVRLQEPELYSEIKLSVNSIPSSFKQFALTRADASSLFGTFRGQQQNINEYTKAIKEHLESYPYCPMVVLQDGQLLTLRAYFSDSFHLEGEQIYIGVGEVLEYNTNNPSISVTPLGTIAIPSQDSYEIALSNVAVGNKFTIGSDTFIVSEGDTTATVKNHFYQGKDKLYVTAGSMVFASEDLGGTFQQNLISPNVQAILINSTGGLDHYKITVSGAFATGNIIQVQATGKTTITYVIQEGDTKTSIEDVLNPDGGNQYHVTSGTIPLITVLTGQQFVANNNSPNFGLVNKQTIAGYSVDRYALFINDNIVAGNVFNIGSQSYTAKTGDTIDDILAYFGKTSTYFLVDVLAGTAFTAFAENGNKYTDSDIADISIIQQPQNRKSTQVVIDCRFNVPEGVYRIGLSHNGEVFQIGNYIQVFSEINEIFNHSEMPIIEVANDGKCFDYDYIEPNLSQCVRAELWVEFPKISTEENIYNLLDAGNTRGVTILRSKSKLVSNTVPIGTCDAYIQWLKHKQLIIDGIRYTCDGEINQSQAVNGYEQFQISTNITQQQERNNKDKFLSNIYIENQYAKLIFDNEILGLQTILVTDTDSRYINNEHNVIDGEYKLLFVVPKNRRIRLEYFRNGTLERSLILLEGINRDSDFLRLYPYDEVVIVVKEYLNELSISESEKELQVDYSNVTYTDEMTQQEENSFNEDFNNDYTI